MSDIWNTTIGQPLQGRFGAMEGVDLTQTLRHLDQYAPLSHKLVLDPSNQAAAATGFGLAPSWVPDDARRRLVAYKLLAAYRLNVARAFLRLHNANNLVESGDHREYGDAALLVDRAVAGILGESQTVTVDGAAAPPPDVPPIPPEPDPPGDGATRIEQAVFTAQHARWEAAATDTLAGWVAEWEAWPALTARQDTLRQWADNEQLATKLDEQEHDAVGLGDGVMTLAWSTRLHRPVLRVYDPGFYFPVLTDDTDGYPTRVHLAWEFVDADRHRFVRRLTWSLEETGTARTYPWHADGETSTRACYFTDATWRFEQTSTGSKIDMFNEAGAVFALTDDGAEARRLDLGIDFIPVVHTPNTPSSKEHFGQSLLTLVAQVLDDLQAVDSDLIAAGKLAAGPVIALSGATVSGTHGGDLVVEPGAVFELGDTGTMTVLDLTAGLAELALRRDDLQKRVSQNARIPEELLGRISSAKAISGVAMALAFGPFTQYVQAARLVRSVKHPLLLKMVQRMFQAGGVFDSGLNPAARVRLGSFLPADRAGLVTEITTLLAAKAISTETAVALLVAGGVPIEDAQHEVDRIRADDPARAVSVADATGSEQLAADWLGVDLPPSTAPPVVTLPPVPPVGGGR